MKHLLFAAALAIATSGCYENFSKPEPMYSFPFDDDGIHLWNLAADPVDGAWALFEVNNDFGYPVYYSNRLDRGGVEDPGLHWGEPSLASFFGDSHHGGTILGDLTDPDRAYVALSYGNEEYYGTQGVTVKLTTGDPDYPWEIGGSVVSEYSSAPNSEFLFLAQNPTDENTLVLAFGSHRSIRVSQSRERGKAWSRTPWTINTASARNELELMGLQYLEDGTLVIFYCVDDIADDAGVYPNYYVRRSTDDGTTWGDDVQVNSHVSGDMNLGGDLFYSGGLTLHATWATDANYKHTTSTDGGLTWQDNTILAWDTAYDPQLTGLRGGDSVVLTARTSLSGDLGTNLHYHERKDSGWSQRRRINQFIGSCGAQGGLATMADGTVVAAWLNEIDDSSTAYAAYSHPDREDDCGIAFDEATLAGDAVVRRGDRFAFSYTVGNYTDAPVELDVYSDVYGKQQFIYRELQRTTVTLDAGEETTIDVSLTVGSGAPHQDYVVEIFADKDGFTTDYEQFPVALIP